MTLSDARTNFQALVLNLFDNRIHRHGIRWYSRDPQTLRWENDRHHSRRFGLLIKAIQMFRDSGELTSTEARVVRQLSTRPGQYTFLAELAPVVAQLPAPPDFDTNREDIPAPAPVVPAVATAPAAPGLQGGVEVFVEQCLVADAWTRAGELYGSYCAWAVEQGYLPASTRRLASVMRAAGIESKRSNGIWWGARVRPESRSRDESA